MYFYKKYLLQLQAYVQQLKYEKDQLSKQLHQVVADQEQSKTHIVEDLKRARRYGILKE